MRDCSGGGAGDLGIVAGEVSSRLANEFTLEGLLLGVLSAGLGVEEPFLVLRVSLGGVTEKVSLSIFPVKTNGTYSHDRRLASWSSSRCRTSRLSAATEVSYSPSSEWMRSYRQLLAFSPCRSATDRMVRLGSPDMSACYEPSRTMRSDSRSPTTLRSSN
jgi:hypothetical protein